MSLFKRSDKSESRLKKIISLVYLKIILFPRTKFIEDALTSFNFIPNVINLKYNKQAVHHSHITGEIVGYAHSFCNRKVRENKGNISVITHNLFGFDFFFFHKVIRLNVWKTTNLAIGNLTKISNLATNINYANIGEI